MVDLLAVVPEFKGYICWSYVDFLVVSFVGISLEGKAGKTMEMRGEVRKGEGKRNKPLMTYSILWYFSFPIFHQCRFFNLKELRGRDEKSEEISQRVRHAVISLVLSFPYTIPIIELSE